MYNKVILIGRLTSTPELHKTNNDKSVARATIAVNRCLLYTSPSPRDMRRSRMPSSA